ncbi:MAG: hypothetical protein FWC53_02965 [Firmicutes bacterium]|nr:hypothetical protein [Bacillota bacterium]
MFRFWYRFIPDNMSNIEKNMGEIIFKEKVLPLIPDYLGSVFEDICIQYMSRRNKKLDLPFIFDSIGRWWGTNPILKEQEEIDFIAKSKNKAIFGECKYRNEKSDIDVLDNLIRKSEMFDNKYTQRYYYLFSKSGFTNGLIEDTKKRKNVELIELNDLYEIK